MGLPQLPRDQNDPGQGFIFSYSGFIASAESCLWLWAPLIAHALGHGELFPAFYIGLATEPALGPALMHSVGRTLRTILRRGNSGRRSWADIYDPSRRCITEAFLAEAVTRGFLGDLLTDPNTMILLAYAQTSVRQACMAANARIEAAEGAAEDAGIDLHVAELEAASASAATASATQGRSRAVAASARRHDALAASLALDHRERQQQQQQGSVAPSSSLPPPALQQATAVRAAGVRPHLSPRTHSLPIVAAH